MTRERLISAQKEELTFSIEQAEKVHIYYLLFHEILSIDEKMATIRCHCVRWMERDMPDSGTRRIPERSYELGGWFENDWTLKKACNMILVHFYRPSIRRDVVEDCRICNICKVMGKQNQNICVAPLRPVPVSEVSFWRVIVDCVGPLPNTKESNLCLLTIMCASTWNHST